MRFVRLPLFALWLAILSGCSSTAATVNSAKSVEPLVNINSLQLAPAEFRLNYDVTQPLTPYTPQPGDIVLSTTDSDTTTLKYALALTWRPTHVGIMVQMNDGNMGVLEAGGGDTEDTHIMPLAERLQRPTDAAFWIRRPRTPLTSAQSTALSEFAYKVNGLPYAKARQIAQGTIFRTRGPIRTFVLGTPQGYREDYICSEVVVEALVIVGLVNAETARPSATFPRDLFFDRSSNPYIDMNPPLANGWHAPALLVKQPGK